jgi:hypothetical protein
LAKLEAGEITKRTHDEYKATCARLIRVFDGNRLVDDLRPDDFETLRADISAKAGGRIARASRSNGFDPFSSGCTSRS